MKKAFILLTMLALAVTPFVGCDSYIPLTSDHTNLGTSDESTIPETSTGTVEVRVTDGPPGYEVQEVEMEVGSVEIHMAEEEQYQNESAHHPCHGSLHRKPPFRVRHEPENRAGKGLALSARLRSPCC